MINPYSALSFKKSLLASSGSQTTLSILKSSYFGLKLRTIFSSFWSLKSWKFDEFIRVSIKSYLEKQSLKELGEIAMYKFFSLLMFIIYTKRCASRKSEPWSFSTHRSDMSFFNIHTNAVPNVNWQGLHVSDEAQRLNDQIIFYIKTNEVPTDLQHRTCIWVIYYQKNWRKLLYIHCI